MKQETKELIDWIKKQINLSGKYNEYCCTAYWIEDCVKAMKFLDSLPQIESRLCQGGYIQDKNGTPCCNGDKVRFKTKALEGILCGKLQWNCECARFEVFVNATDSEHYDWTLIMPDIEEFEKVE